jgi:hypothetical protein
MYLERVAFSKRRMGKCRSGRDLDKKNWEGGDGEEVSALCWPPPHTLLPKEEKEEKIAFCN